MTYIWQIREAGIRTDELKLLKQGQNWKESVLDVEISTQ